MTQSEPGGAAANEETGGSVLAWNPMGLVLALIICSVFVGLTGMALFNSGEVGVILHGLAFLLTGAVVVGFIIYTATLSGDEH